MYFTTVLTLIMTIASIRQPGYLPYMGFFKKIQTSDIFVYLDDVQYVRGDWDNRNKIRTFDGSMWLTIPIINKFGQKLNEVKIDNNQDWYNKHRKALKINYQKSKYFYNYWGSIDAILSKKWELLIDLNLTLIEYFKAKLDIKTKTILSSELKIDSKGSEKLLQICKKVGAKTYLSGEIGRNYLNEKIFQNEGIVVLYEKFRHPTYKQIYKNFMPNMAIVDLLFNEGDYSKEIISKSTNM